MNEQEPKKEAPRPSAEDAAARDVQPASAPEDAQDSAEHDLPSSAADDPTAMWNEDDLRDAGMDDVAERVKSLPPPAATAPNVGGDARESVVVGDGGSGSSPQASPAPRTRRAPPGSGLSWPLTIGLAVLLGAAVYFLVRLMR